ncbi:MAG: hypothetical protein HQ553_00845 [Chloroflexi bacterium]|nr:hypothetical protein [Chloroflexota bacterium]
MKQQDLLKLITSQFISNLKVVSLNGGFKVELPFKDPLGDPIEILVTPTNDGLLFDDLGHTASLLFHLRQHREESPGHLLTRNLTDAYALTMDYDQGLLSVKLSFEEDTSQLLDFIKVLISAQTVLPEIQRRKRERRGGKRLDARLRQEIQQLSLAEYVMRQEEVSGKYEVWTVDYKYVSRTLGEPEDVLIVAADLHGREPRLKAEHVITLANDVLEVDETRHLRVVYDVNGNSTHEPAQRAAAMIQAYQDKIGYQAYDFGDSRQKQALASLTHQELSPLALGSSDLNV